MTTKNHIIAEIKRTAAENGGAPLGRERFFAETGIKESDWHGRYWVRWGEVLAEAGFDPNKWNAAIPDAELLSQLAALVKELGHFPVQGEMKLKARSASSFPSHNTFRRRFGGKQALAQKLRAFCLEQGDQDVAALCDTAAGSPSVAEPVEEQRGDSELGFVYLMKSGRFYKIGRTNAVGRRERELATQLPERARVVHSIKTDDPAGIEAYWHNRFRDRHKNGEWFELTSRDVSAFRRRKFM